MVEKDGKRRRGTDGGPCPPVMTTQQIFCISVAVVGELTQLPKASS